MSQAQVLPLRPQPSNGRGAAWSAEDVAREIFNGKVSARWVKDNFKPGRDKIGYRTVIWWENEVRRWRDQHPLTGAA